MGEEPISSRAFGFRLDHNYVKFLDLLRPYVLALGWGSALVLITNLAMACLPILINGGVSFIEKDHPFELKVLFLKIEFSSIYWILTAIIGLAVFAAIIRTLSRMVLFDVGRTVERDIRARMFFQISTLDEDFFSNTSVGDLMNHLTTDISNIRMVTGFAALNVMNIIFVFCFTVPLLLKIDVTLALCALLPFPLVMMAMSLITKRMFLATIHYQETLGDLANHVQENLLGAHVVRLFHQQQPESARFKATNLNTFHAGVGLARVRVLMQPVMRLMVGVAVGLVLYVGGRAIMAGRLSVGDFVEVNARILQLAWPAMSVGFVMSVYSRGQASLKRLNQLLRYQPLISDGEHHLSTINKIEVHNLKLNPKSEDVVSLQVTRGQLLGIVGPSGSYKTTLLKAINHRHEVPYGTIFFDEHDLNDISLSSIYEHISIVSQETFLFHKSIKENIRFAKPNATDEEIHEVITIVRLDNDLAQMTEGIDTVIGERGVTLSGGQRQRVALARALLAERAVIILDDALSAVDADTERHIVSRLRKFLKDSIVIIATHRLSAIRDADEILVLEHGRIADEGVHDQLIKSSRLYQSLWGIDQLSGHWL